MFSTFMVGVQLLILHAVFSVYHASLDNDKTRRMESFIQAGLVAVIISSYIKFYSISIFHPSLILRADSLLFAGVILICVILQLSLFQIRKSRLAACMLILTLVNVGLISIMSI